MILGDTGQMVKNNSNPVPTSVLSAKEQETLCCFPDVSGRKSAENILPNGQAVHEIINQALEKLEEMQVPMPDYALKSAGAVTLYKQTSSKALPVQIDKMGIGTCPGLGEKGRTIILATAGPSQGVRDTSSSSCPCWSFRAVTTAHVSGTAFHGESISGAPKDFAVYGSKEEHEEQGTFLGQFTFLATRNPSQTFQLKDAVSGILYLGYYIYGAVSGMPYLGCRIWDAVSGMPYLGCRIWDAVSGMPYLGCCICDVLSGIL
ncbi:hypothetical protein Q9233_003017 [Columba guinea]|nr:hypothetical protein Q9233_003017 [Columba guinea]